MSALKIGKIGIIQSSILQMRKLTPKEMKGLVPGHKSETLVVGIWDQALTLTQVTLSPQVCAAETLGCFWLELTVIGFEEGPSVGTAVFWLQRLLEALGSPLWVTAQGLCLPCEEYPQRPVSLFLAKLLELLQGACAWHRPSA